MNRQLSIAILLLAVLSVLAGYQFLKPDDPAQAGCVEVRRAYERVSFVEKAGDVPTSDVYADVATSVRVAAASAPPTIAQPVAQLADAYVQLGNLFEGFDPDKGSTYHVYEDNAAAIERQQTIVDATVPEVRDWLSSRCS